MKPRMGNNMTQSASNFRELTEYASSLVPFRVRKRFGNLLFPRKLEQYLLAEAAGVVASILRDEDETGNAVVYGDNYWYFPDMQSDASRPLLVAHVDTVCSPFPPSELRRTGSRIRNPHGILGADDRAGVFAALELRRRTGVGVLLCDEEESGAHGARAAAAELAPLLKTHPYMVELDRKGHRQVVYYRTECAAFCDHIESYGFTKEWGSFSDISILSRELDVPGANVSIGFNYQHTSHEYLDLFSLWDTIERVQRIIEENKTVILTPAYPRYYASRGYGVVSGGLAKEDDDDKDLEQVVDLDVIEDDDRMIPLTPEEIDHMVALDLEKKDAERVAYLEARQADWEQQFFLDDERFSRE